MLAIRRFCLTLVLCFACFGQAQSPLNSNELKYFRFMLMNLASIDHHPDAAVQYSHFLVEEFGLSPSELATILNAAQTLKAVLTSLRAQSQKAAAGSSIPGSDYPVVLTGLIAQRDQVIQTLSNQIINAVSSETALRLRQPGKLAVTFNIP